MTLAPAPDALASALQSHRGTRALQHLIEHAPSTGGLALWARHVDLPDADPAPPAPVLTDGHSLFYAPGYASLPLEMQAGAVAHVLLHLALRHPQRAAAQRALTGDIDEALFTTCADAIVNTALGHLRWLRLPAGAVTLPGLLASALGIEADATAALAGWDLEGLYRAIDDREPPSPHAPRNRRRDGTRAARVRALGVNGRSAPDLILPDQTVGRPTTRAPSERADDTPEAEAAIARDWRERLLRAHASDGAFSLLRGLLADLAPPRTPWQQVLRTQLTRALAARPGLSWSRPARSYIARQGRAGAKGSGRRLPWEPGRSASTPVPRLVVVLDVSGSIEDTLLQRFAREIGALSRRLGAGLTLVVGDDAVRAVRALAPHEDAAAALAALKFHGGGGTDFTPLLAEAARHGPDLIVVLTDLQGPARQRPPCPVLWAVPPPVDGEPTPEPPFGRVLRLQD